MARTCVFCGTASVTVEHVWPQWMRSLPPVAEIVNARLIPQEILRTRVLPANVLGFPVTLHERVGSTNPKASDLKIKRVCATCNNGWMSALEVRVQPIIRKLIPDGPVRLSAREQQTLATWAVKTTMLYTLWYPHQPLFDADHFRALMRRDEWPERSIVYVGRALAPQAQMALAWHPIAALPLPPVPTEADKREVWLAMQTARPTRARVYLAVAGVVFLVHYDLLADGESIDLPEGLAESWCRIGHRRWRSATVPRAMSERTLGDSIDALQAPFADMDGNYTVRHPADRSSRGAMRRLLREYRGGGWDERPPAFYPVALTHFSCGGPLGHAEIEQFSPVRAIPRN